VPFFGCQQDSLLARQMLKLIEKAQVALPAGF